MILDDGGDATMLVHKGTEYEKAGAVPEPRPASPRSARSSSSCSQQLARGGPSAGRRSAKGIMGVTEETTTGVHRLYQMAETGDLLFPAINVNDSVTKSKFDNLYGCRHSLIDGINRGHRRDDRRQGRRRLRLRRRRQGLRRVPARPGRPRDRHRDRPDLRPAGGDGGLPGRRLEDVVETADIFITATGNKDIITAEHMARMKHQAIVGNIGHFDNEIDMAGLGSATTSSGSTSSRRSTSAASPTATR